jgi:hypothetical protein
MTKLTDPRRRGLLAALHPAARISNVTDERLGYVYWQTAEWLIANGHATRGSDVANARLELTAEGRQLALEQRSR